MIDKKIRYNKLLARIKAGDKHYSKIGMDEHFGKFMALIREANTLLSIIPHTEEEVENGFDLITN